MTTLTVLINGGEAWEDDPPRTITRFEGGILSALPRGTSSGKPSVALLVRDGDTGYLIETTLGLWLAAADLLRMAYGDPLTDGWTQPEALDALAHAESWVAEFRQRVEASNGKWDDER